MRTSGLKMNVHLLAVSSLSREIAREGSAIDKSVASNNASANTFRECIEECSLSGTTLSH
jgi:hypothetical protein